MQCACVILSSAACPALQYFSHYLLIGTIFEKKKKKFSEHKMCFLIFSTPFVWNISHSKKKCISEFKSDLEDKLQNYNKINGAIRRHFRKQMNKETKLRIHNITAKAALKFGSEAWVLKKREEQRLEAAQMKFLRHLLGITKLDKGKTNVLGKNRSTEYSIGNKTVPGKVATTHTEDGHKQDT